MAGLEKILEDIKRENNDIIFNIKQEAEETAKKMIDDKKAELDERGRFMDKKMEKVIKLDIEKGISSAQSFKRKMILEEKQKQIKYMVEQSKEYIKNLPKDEYIEFSQRKHKAELTVKTELSDSTKLTWRDMEKSLSKKLTKNCLKMAREH